MSAVIGIDLGTTYSAAAHLDRNGRPQVLRNRDGDLVTPSVVLLDEGGALVGAMAKRGASASALDTIQFVKRFMGDPDWVHTGPDGQTFRPEEISALVLRRLKEDAEEVLGTTVDQAVITVPAYFDDARRRATQHAGEIAGLQVLRVLNEPTAAALAYGLEHRLDGRLLVYDLGGGTFDVTVMDVRNGSEFAVLGTEGDRNLGGFDWDNKLMQHLDQAFQADGGPSLLDDVESTAGLRERAELAKRTLTSAPQAAVLLSKGGHTARLTVTREEFERLTVPLLYRTEVLVEGLLDDLGTDWDAIDHVLLVGGSTRMPQVRRRLALWTAPDKVLRSQHVDELVALGAAVQAGLEAAHLDRDAATALAPEARSALQRVRVTDVTSQGVGVLVQDPETRRDENSVVIPRNTRIPVSASSRYGTTTDGQEALRLRVTQGDDEDPAFVSVIGEQEIRVPPRPAGSPVDITFRYGVDQTVSIEVRDGNNGRLVGAFDVRNDANMPTSGVQAAATRLKTIPSA